jgi:acetyl-CoA synthetase
VFGGFSGNACGTRIADSGSDVLITMDGYYRAGGMTDHKVKAIRRRRGARSCPAGNPSRCVCGWG